MHRTKVGAGDGRFLIKALQRGADFAEGWELSKPVYELAKAHLFASLSIADQRRAKIVNGNGKNAPFKEFDVVVLYLLPSGLEALRPYLLSSLTEFDAKGNSEYAEADYEMKERGQKYNGKQNINDCKKITRLVTQGWPIKELKVVDTCITKGGSALFLHKLVSLSD